MASVVDLIIWTKQTVVQEKECDIFKPANIYVLNQHICVEMNIQI